eukprot:4829450-Prymnesium_polylepis.1
MTIHMTRDTQGCAWAFNPTTNCNLHPQVRACRAGHGCKPVRGCPPCSSPHAREARAPPLLGHSAGTWEGQGCHMTRDRGVTRGTARRTGHECCVMNYMTIQFQISVRNSRLLTVHGTPHLQLHIVQYILMIGLILCDYSSPPHRRK